jgi:glycosyltransferase involved in cell wall biosynthesis
MVKTKPKVLFMVQLPPPTHGPALRNQTIVSSDLVRSKINIAIVPMQFSDSIEEIGKISLYKYVRLISHLVKLIKRILVFRPHIAYFTISPVGNSFLRDCFFVLILKVFRIRQIYHLRGLGIKECYNRSGLFRFLYKWAFRDSVIVLLSEGHRSDICFDVHKKIFVIPNGIEDFGIFSFPEKESVQNRLLYFSNLVTTKGVFVFIDSVDVLIKKGYKVSATICGENGDATYEQVHDYIVKMNLENTITLRRGIFGKDKHILISQCDIFILPTYLELFPGVVLEAMQCGKAIVSTTTGAIPEIIDDRINGLLTSKKNDPVAIADLTEYYLLNPELISLHGALARKKYEEKYRSEIFEKNMAEMFMDVFYLK